MIKFIKSLFTYKTDTEDNNTDDVFSRVEAAQVQTQTYITDSGTFTSTSLPVSGQLSEWWGYLIRPTGSKE